MSGRLDKIENEENWKVKDFYHFWLKRDINN